MTMPNPVAEVVELLRSIGGPTREEAADLLERQQAEIEAWRDTAKLFESQSAEIERLSRERDTATNWINGLEDTICEGISYISGGLDTTALFELERVLEDRSCLEQRPTFLAPVRSLEPYRSAKADVSRESDTGVPEEVAKRIHDINEVLQSLWGAEDSNTIARALGSERLGKVLDAQNALYAMLSAAPPPPTVSTQGWQQGKLSDLLTVTRERDQAREALAKAFPVFRDAIEIAVRKGIAVDWVQFEAAALKAFERARSVLHQEEGPIDTALSATPAPEAPT